MTENKMETAKGWCVIALTKYLMERYHKSQDAAYQQLIGMELYQLLMDEGTGLFLETNDYLCKCCELECEQGEDALYHFINADE
jgi:hypothetical protein